LDARGPVGRSDGWRRNRAPRHDRTAFHALTSGSCDASAPAARRSGRPAAAPAAVL
jgi:hypothetical protein